MRPRRSLHPVALAATGLFAVVIGIHAELLHARPMYDFTITTGWDRVPGHPYWIHPLNHEERLLAQLAGVGLLGAVAALRWRQAAVIPALVGGVVVFSPVRAVLGWFGRGGVYTGIPGIGDPSGRVVLGAEPYLLVLGGLLFVGAGVFGWRASKIAERTESEEVTTGAPAG